MTRSTMRRGPLIFTLGLLGLALLAAGCGGGGGSDSGSDEGSNGSAGATGAVVGTHECKSPEDTEATVY